MKPSKCDIPEKALDLGFRVSNEYTKHAGKEHVRVSVSWEQDEQEFLSGHGPTAYLARCDLKDSGGRQPEEALRVAANEVGELCVRVAEAREDFSLLNRNIEGKRPIGSLSRSGEHDDDHVIAKVIGGGGEAHVVYGDEVVASAGADTVQEAVSECLRQLQKKHQALLDLHAYAAGDGS